MTTYRLWPSTNGPTLTGYSGNFRSGINFGVTSGGNWFQGYWWWVPAGGDTGAQKFCLWAMTSSGTGLLVSSATVTSGTLTAGQWNYVPLPSPIQLSIGMQYNACTGWVAVNGFADTQNQFGAGDPYAAGITNGPLIAYSDTGGSAPTPFGTVQGCFDTSTSDPASSPVVGADLHSNFWIDLQVSDTAPPGYSGSYRLWPNVGGDDFTQADAAVNYTVGTEIRLSQACTLNRVWYFSPGGTAQLATRCDVWNVNTQGSVAAITSPSWSGAAGSGWVHADFAGGTTLPAGTYRVTVYNGAATPDAWASKRLGYWGSSASTSGFPLVAPSGITNGPLYAPATANASNAYTYDAAGGSNTPPYSDGSTQEPGQSVFEQGPPNMYPWLYVDALFQNYWVDLEATPLATTPNVPTYTASMSSM